MSLEDQLVSVNITIPRGGGLRTKDEVNYRHAQDDQRCDRCDYYVPQEHCQLVAGRIYGHGTCDLWEEGSDDPADPTDTESEHADP